MSRRRPFPFARRRSYPAWVAVLLAALVLVRWWQSQNEPPPPAALAEGLYAVQRVVDGDTLLLANGARVRLIGADTPETVKPNWPEEPFGREATEFTQRFVAESGGTVRLQFDRERLDQYERFLAYVFDGRRMLNEELIRAGLATAETGFRYASGMKTRFRRAEDEARAAGRGIWSLDAERTGSL